MKIAVIAAAALVSGAILVNGELDRRREQLPYSAITSGDYRCTIRASETTTSKTTSIVTITALTDRYIVIEGQDLETTIPTITLIPRDNVSEIWCVEEMRRKAMVEAIIASGRLNDGDGVDLTQFARDPAEAAAMQELILEMERRVDGK